MKRTILALTLSLSLAVTGCTAPAAEDTTPPAGSDQPVVSAPVDLTAVDTSLSMSEYTTGLDPDGVAMTVNGVPVTNRRYLYWLADDCKYLESIYQTYYGITPDLSDPTLAQAIREDAQGIATSFQVLLELYDQYNITLTEEQQKDVDTMLDEYDPAELEKLLHTYGITREEYREIYSDNHLYTNLIAQAVPAPTPADLEAYMEANEVFGVKHILLKTVGVDQTDEAGNVTETMEDYNARQRKLAEELLARLQQADDVDALFSTLMEEHSEDGRDEEGRLAAPDGYVFSAADSLVGGFREATLALKVGELSGIVETDYGYHILMRLPVEPAFVEKECRDGMIKTFLADHMDRAEVEVSDAIQELDIAAFYHSFLTYQAAVYQ